MRICDSKSHARFGIPFDLPVAPPKRHDSSHAVAPTTGSNPALPANALTSQLPRRVSKHRLLATLMEFPFPSTLELRRVHSTPACLTGYVPSSGFHTLSTVCSSSERPALFHADNAHGISLSRGFPSLPGSAGSSPRKYPLDVSPTHRRIVNTWRPSLHAETRFSDLYRLQGLAPTVNPYHLRTVTSLAMADPLLSFGYLSRVLPSLTGHVSRYVIHSCASPSLGVFGQMRDKPTFVLRQAGCASAASPESAGFCSEEQKIPS